MKPSVFDEGYYYFLSSQGLPLARKWYKDLKARLLRIELPNKCHGLQVSVFAGRFFYTAAILKKIGHSQAIQSADCEGCL